MASKIDHRIPTLPNLKICKKCLWRAETAIVVGMLSTVSTQAHLTEFGQGGLARRIKVILHHAYVVHDGVVPQPVLEML